MAPSPVLVGLFTYCSNSATDTTSWIVKWRTAGLFSWAKSLYLSLKRSKKEFFVLVSEIVMGSSWWWHPWHLLHLIRSLKSVDLWMWIFIFQPFQFPTELLCYCVCWVYEGQSVLSYSAGYTDRVFCGVPKLIQTEYITKVHYPRLAHPLTEQLFTSLYTARWLIAEWSQLCSGSSGETSGSWTPTQHIDLLEL